MANGKMGKMVLCALVIFFAIGGFALDCRAQEQAAPAKTTLENLMAAFNGESNANARYLSFAAKADEEGYGKVASLFRAAARAEQVHFEHHAAVIKELGGTPSAKIEAPVVKSTRENLEEALKGETYESNVMYPEFLAKAEKDKIVKAVDTFEDAKAAEAVHAGWYKKALANMDAWKGAKMDLYVCPKCGNVVDVLPGLACPICMEDTKKFIPVS
jgi:rubrerythrin